MKVAFDGVPRDAWDGDDDVASSPGRHNEMGIHIERERGLARRVKVEALERKLT